MKICSSIMKFSAVTTHWRFTNHTTVHCCDFSINCMHIFALINHITDLTLHNWRHTQFSWALVWLQNQQWTMKCDVIQLTNNYNQFPLSEKNSVATLRQKRVWLCERPSYNAWLSLNALKASNIASNNTNLFLVLVQPNILNQSTIIVLT